MVYGIKTVKLWKQKRRKEGNHNVYSSNIQDNGFYFGRTLDYEFSYGDEVAVLPRNYALTFRHMGVLKAHYAIIGMAYVVGDYPLYYDGINEKGLGMAGLNFVGNAVYQKIEEGRENIAQFEFIPWILAQCASVVKQEKSWRR